MATPHLRAMRLLKQRYPECRQPSLRGTLAKLAAILPQEPILGASDRLDAALEGIEEPAKTDIKQFILSRWTR